MMKSEFYIENKELVTRQDWEKAVQDIKKSVKEDLNDKDKAKQLLSKEIIKAIEDRLPDEKFGILFSGGIDSALIALIAKKAGKDFVCYTVGFKDEGTKEPEDIIYAKKSAEQLGVELRIKIVSLEQAQELFKKSVKILGEVDEELNYVVYVGVASVEVACIEMAKEDGVKYLLTGLGSEEIFAGYERHRLAEIKQDECWKGLTLMYERDFVRDFKVASNQSIVFSTPFLDKELIGVAMRIPDKLKINDKDSKIIIREVAEDLGLSKEIAWRKKVAAQYGSRIDKAIQKLSKRKGFEFKKDYLKSLQ